MNREPWQARRYRSQLGIRIAVMVAAGALGLAACGGDSTDTAPVEDAGAGGTAAVSIVDFAFAPAELTVSTGTEVTWKNDQAASHTVTGDDGEFDSANLAEGAEFSQTFDTAGTFTYHCEIHPTMTGTVTVEG